MAIKYKSAPEVEKLVSQLIKECPEFVELQRANIICRFRCGSWKSRGKDIQALAKLLSPYERFELAAELSIQVNENFWIKLTAKQKEALIFHQLCHFKPKTDNYGANVISKQDQRIVYQLVDHDFEEFKSVITKYGLWMPYADDGKRVEERVGEERNE